MPSSRSTTVAASSAPMQKLLPLLLPFLFLALQHGQAVMGGGSSAAGWRMSPQSMKVAFRVALVCVASVAALAASVPLLGANTHPVYRTHGGTSSWSVYSPYVWRGSTALTVIPPSTAHGTAPWSRLENGDTVSVCSSHEKGSSVTDGRTPEMGTIGLASPWVSSAEGTATPSARGSTPDAVALPVPAEPRMVYRHDPYSFRGYRRMDVHNDTHHVTFSVGATEVDVPLAALLKEQQCALDLRRRGRRGEEVKEKQQPQKEKEASAPSRVSRNPATTQARKAFRKAVEASGLKLQEPIYPVVVHPELFDVALRPVVQYPEQRSAARTGAIEDGMTTLTGLPNTDGHRVATAVLQRMQEVGIVKGPWALATPPRRLDRFNTGACHVDFDNVDDALRVQQALRQYPLFASFREGTLVVGHAMQ